VVADAVAALDFTVDKAAHTAGLYAQQADKITSYAHAVVIARVLLVQFVLVHKDSFQEFVTVFQVLQSSSAYAVAQQAFGVVSLQLRCAVTQVRAAGNALILGYTGDAKQAN